MLRKAGTLHLTVMWALALLTHVALGQMQVERISGDEALDRAFKNNVLTYEGKPFHALMRIADAKDDPEYRGQVELWWVSAQKYRLAISAPSFSQTLVVNGLLVSEADTGDFYPQWLHGFVLALMDPMPRAKDLRGRGQVALGEHMRSCIDRNDKVNGITNDMTWAHVCFSGEKPTLDFAMDFTYNMEFHDFKKFGKKQIAYTYIAGEGDHARPTGRLLKLEEIDHPDESMFEVKESTPAKQRILTTFVSIAQQESMREIVPADVTWPEPHEGPIEGFMIVHAITDRTGQVRETSKHNSANAEMESMGRLVALKYKFKPLVIDRIPQQMELPLVLHFASKQIAPMPELSDEETRKMVTGCTLPKEIDDPDSAGKLITIQFKIYEDGGLGTLGSSDQKIPVLKLYGQFRGCKFKVLQKDGVPTIYHANISVVGR